MPKFSKNYMILRLAPLDLLIFYFRTIGFKKKTKNLYVMAEPLVHRFLYRLIHRHIEKHFKEEI